MLQKRESGRVAGRPGRTFAFAALLWTLMSGGQPAQGSPLNLALQPYPAMFSDAIAVSYDAASQSFSASGFAEHVKCGSGAATPIAGGLFEIRAAIGNGGSVRSGTLTVTGALPSLGIAPGTLLIGRLTQLGYDEAGGAVEFQFETSGGELALQFGPVIKVVLGQSGFTGSFGRDFGNGSIGVAGIGW